VRIPDEFVELAQLIDLDTVRCIQMVGHHYPEGLREQEIARIVREGEQSKAWLLRPWIKIAQMSLPDPMVMPTAAEKVNELNDALLQQFRLRGSLRQ